MGSNFTIGDLVGRGGFAEVFAVRDNRLKRDLAVKVLSPELVVNQAMLTRFRREAEAVAALRHPGIVPIYDVGESGGIAYIMMPLIPGETLRKTLERDNRIPIPESRRILVEVSNALHVAHSAGLVHRDIKPENIMLEGPKKQVLVMDFGIAKALDPESTGMTTSGLIVGTPHYMSPEQASGEAIDARSDQYSLAVLGYRMVTGTHPFEAETTRALLYKQVFESPAPAAERFADVPADLSTALHRGMSKEPKDRFPTIEEFAAAVRGGAGESRPALGVTMVSPARPTPAAVPARGKPEEKAKAPPTPKPRKVSTVIFAAGAAASLLAVLAVARSVLTSSSSSRAPSGTVPPAASAPSPAQGAAPQPPPAPRPQPPVSRPQVAGREPPRTGADAAGPRPTTTRAAPPPVQPTFSTCGEAVAKSAWPQAAPLCRTEADQGKVDAQLALGAMFDRGQGLEADAAQAAEWYTKASDGGSGEAAYRLGLLHEEGRGVAKNPTKAGELYLQAARRGVVPAMRATARQYETGAGLRKNDAEAVNWYRRAAAAGDAPAEARLGDFFAQGRGVSRNDAEAVRWYTRAAESGDAAGQYALAMAYFSGRGVASSDSSGLQWLRRAAAQGHPQAVEELGRRAPP